jgi:hypothetical protein
MINERNIIESFRGQLLGKEKNYNHLLSEHRSLKVELEQK